MKQKKNKNNEEKINIDDDMISKAESYITDAFKNQKKDKIIHEEATGANFGYVTETDHDDPMNHLYGGAKEDVKEDNFLSKIDTSTRPEYEEINLDESDEEIEVQKEDKFLANVEENKPKKKKSPVMIFIFIVSIIMLITLSIIYISPYINNRNEVEPEISVSPTVTPISTEDSNRNENLVIESKVVPLTTIDGLTVNDSLKLINDMNVAIVDYFNEITGECLSYSNNSSDDIESILDKYNEAILNDINNFNTYKELFSKFNGDNIFEVLKKRLENIYMYTDSIKNTMSRDEIIANCNSYIYQENIKNEETNNLIEGYLVYNDITYTKANGFISYVPAENIEIIPTENQENQEENIETASPVSTNESTQEITKA